jgi:2-iminobutanoate/2-iminopropanoate deaminase
MVYCSGCLGMDPSTKALVPGGVAAEAKQVLENMKNILEAAGSSMNKVVKCTILLKDIAFFAEVNAVYAEYFPSEPPARATFAVAGLPAGALVEIDCIAIA